MVCKCKLLVLKHVSVYHSGVLFCKCLTTHWKSTQPPCLTSNTCLHVTDELGQTQALELLAAVCYKRCYWPTASISPGSRPMRGGLSFAGLWQNRYSAKYWKLYPVWNLRKVNSQEAHSRNLTLITDVRWEIQQRVISSLFTVTY